MENKIIERSFEIRLLDQDSRTITGQAVVFDSWSRDLGGFNEIIRPGAITDELLQRSDVIFNINHDNNQMVARYRQGSGTLRLDLRADGLYFEFDAPETERGNELLWNVKNRNFVDCSFAFSLPKNETCERWFRQDGCLKREITEIGALWDCSIVTVGAYSDTFVDAREKINLDVINRSLDEKEIAERQKEINEKLDEKLKQFYNNINI